MFPISSQRSPVESRKTIAVLAQTGSRWGSSTVSCGSASDFREGLPVTQRESATPATQQRPGNPGESTNSHLVPRTGKSQGSVSWAHT